MTAVKVGLATTVCVSEIRAEGIEGDGKVGVGSTDANKRLQAFRVCKQCRPDDDGRGIWFATAGGIRVGPHFNSREWAARFQAETGGHSCLGRRQCSWRD